MYKRQGKDILYDVIPNDLSSIKSWLTRTFEKFFLSEDSLVVCAEHTGQYTYPCLLYTSRTRIRFTLLLQTSGMKQPDKRTPFLFITLGIVAILLLSLIHI